MSSVIEEIRGQLSNDGPPPLELANHEGRLVGVVTGDSLGALVASAMAARKRAG